MNHNIIRNIIMIVAALSIGISASGAENNPLAPALSKLSSANSILVSFYLDAPQAKLPGTMIIEKSKYHLASGNYMVWYDGKTMWTYLKKSRELSISEPTPEELMQSNPFEILSRCNEYYNVSRLSPRSDGLQRVSVVPKSGTPDTGLVRATVTLGKDNWPKSIKADFSSGESMTFEIKKITPGKNLPLTDFRYDAKKYPASETTDLR